MSGGAGGIVHYIRSKEQGAKDQTHEQEAKSREGNAKTVAKERSIFDSCVRLDLEELSIPA